MPLATLVRKTEAKKDLDPTIQDYSLGATFSTIGCTPVNLRSSGAEIRDIVRHSEIWSPFSGTKNLPPGPPVT